MPCSVVMHSICRKVSYYDGIHFFTDHSQTPVVVYVRDCERKKGGGEKETYIGISWMDRATAVKMRLAIVSNFCVLLATFP